MNASIDLTTLFWICSGIAGMYAVWKIVKGPFVKLDDHERRITSVEKSLIERKDTDTLILKSLNACGCVRRSVAVYNLCTLSDSICKL